MQEQSTYFAPSDDVDAAEAAGVAAAAAGAAAGSASVAACCTDGVPPGLSSAQSQNVSSLKAATGDPRAFKTKPVPAPVIPATTSVPSKPTA